MHKNEGYNFGDLLKFSIKNNKIIILYGLYGNNILSIVYYTIIIN